MTGLVIVNKNSKFEVNIFCKDRDTRKKLIRVEILSGKRGIAT